MYEFSFTFFIGKKAYDEWEIGEVLKKFLHQDGSSIANVCKFKITAVKHVQSIEENLELKAKEWLDGTNLWLWFHWLCCLCLKYNCIISCRS